MAKAKRQQHGWPLTPSFTNYLKLSENDVLLNSMKPGLKLQNIRYKSPEGGYDTVGFGHLMSKEEHDSGFINGVRVSEYKRADIDKLFYRDQSAVWDRLAKKVKSEHKTDLKSLSIRQREMLFDFEYNVANGIKEFPKFSTAVIKGDYATALNESKRHYTDGKTGEKKEMTTRNQLFAAQFFNKDARNGDYTSPEAQASSVDTIKQIRHGEGELAVSEAAAQLPAGGEERAAQKRHAKTQESVVEEATQPQQEQPQQEQAPQALASNMPAPNIDLGGMLSKEYVAPSGEKGMLSPLSTNEQNTSMGPSGYA